MKEFKGNVETKFSVIKFAGANCGACKMYAPFFESVADELSSDDVSFYEVSIDSNEGVEIGFRYGVGSIPATVILNEEGKAIFNKAGAFPVPILKRELLAHIEA